MTRHAERICSCNCKNAITWRSVDHQRGVLRRKLLKAHCCLMNTLGVVPTLRGGGSKSGSRHLQYARLNEVKNFRGCVDLPVRWDMLSKTHVETLAHRRGYFPRKMVAPFGFP